MVEAEVFEVIGAHIRDSNRPISLDTPLDELGIDSLGAITILYELEDRFGIEVPNEVFDTLSKVGDIVDKGLQDAVAEIDGGEHEVGPGDFMGFPTPSLGHHLRNPFDEDLVYLMGGERHAAFGCARGTGRKF